MGIMASVVEEDVVEGLGLDPGLCRTYAASNPRSFPKWLDLSEAFKVCRKRLSGVKKGHYLGDGVHVICRVHVSGPGAKGNTGDLAGEM